MDKSIGTWEESARNLETDEAGTKALVPDPKRNRLAVTKSNFWLLIFGPTALFK